MTVFPGVVVPAIPPRPPQLSLLNSSIKPDETSDPSINGLGEVPADQLGRLPDRLRAELEERIGEGWVRGFTYAPENHWPAEVRDPCDFTSIDLPALSTPTGLAAVGAITGGTLAAATYSYQVSAINANGETVASSIVTGVVASGTTGSVALTWNALADTTQARYSGAAQQYKIYGRVGGSIGLIATVGPFAAGATPSYTDTGTPAPGAPPPASNTTAGPGSYTNLPINVIVPYLLMVEDECSTWGLDERDFKGRALRLLENAQHQALEKEFWTGALATAKGWPNRFLADANVTDLTPGGGPPSVTRGQQILQDALASCGFGGQGMLHVQPQTAPNLLGARRVGNLLLDVFDNIVVPGVGYPGTGPNNVAPAAGTAWMFATDLVQARTEEEGTVFPDSFAEATDWGQGREPNTIRFRAQKFGAAYFDGACQFACRVTLAV